jgi:hypothetical protein
MWPAVGKTTWHTFRLDLTLFSHVVFVVPPCATLSLSGWVLSRRYGGPVAPQVLMFNAWVWRLDVAAQSVVDTSHVQYHCFGCAVTVPH